jgi:glycosyltransferase 2 family protein
LGGIRQQNLEACVPRRFTEEFDLRTLPRSDQWLKLVPGYLLAFAGLVWVLHDFRFADLLAQIKQLKWEFAILALICELLGYICQAYRWRLLLKNVGEISLLRATQALCAGLFVSEVLPLSPGEPARSYLAARWMNVRFASAFPTVLVERLFDGLWISTGIGLTAIFLPLPEDFLIAGDIFGALVLLGTAALVWVILRRPYNPASHTPPNSRAKRFLQQLIEGLYNIGLNRNFYLSFAVSLAFLMLQGVTLWLMLRSYSINLSFWIAMAVMLLILIATAAPGAPGNVGTWQFSCVLGLTLFGVDKSIATGFSLVCYTLLSIWLIFLGFISLSRIGIPLLKLRRAASNENTIGVPPPGGQSSTA